MKSDFPYRKRPYPQEVPFADHLSVVRLLGGHDDRVRDKGDKGKKTETGAVIFNDNPNAEINPEIHKLDLAYRDPSGQVKLRADLLRAKLKPYLDNGYQDLTLVLDATPYCFSKTPIYGAYGNAAPPDNIQEWSKFIEELAAEIEVVMGEGAANKLRFRVGTEMNGSERFAGTEEQFFEFYSQTAAAVKKILPDAQFGPFNNSGVSLRSVTQTANVKFFSLAEHCLKHSIEPAGLKKLPLDWFAFSRYYSPGEDDPDQRTAECQEVWDAFDQRFPAYAPVSREMHEFGVQTLRPKPGQFTSSEPGAYGAALTFQIIARLKQYGIQRQWHWLLMDPFRDKANNLCHIIESQGWLYNILDHMAGGEACLVLPEKSSLPNDVKHLCLVSAQSNRTYLLMSAYHMDFAYDKPTTVEFAIRKEYFPNSLSVDRFKVLRLNRSTALHDQIRRDMEAAGQLNAGFQKDKSRIGTIREMAVNRATEKLVGEKQTYYEKLWIKSLTLQEGSAKDGSVSDGEEYVKVKVQCAPPELVVFVFENN